MYKLTVNECLTNAKSTTENQTLGGKKSEKTKMPEVLCHRRIYVKMQEIIEMKTVDRI